MVAPDHYTIAPVTDAAGWAEARAIREEVFIGEQHCPPEEEWDEYDDVSRHFVGYADGEAVSVARWRVAYHENRAVAKLERFAVARSHRGRGYGRTLVRAVIADASRAGFHVFLLHAQAYLEAFYRDFGFERISDEFVEAGIPHVAMLRRDG